jgi:hypothetical protein
MIKWLRKRRERFRKRWLGFTSKPDWWADGVGVCGKNMGWLNNDKFQQALKFANDGNVEGWKKAGYVPYIPWRTHVALWAASNALHLEGDLVECGVHTGLLSMAICDYLDFDKYPDKKFYLFDTYEGIPEEGLDGTDKAMASKYNEELYYDVYAIVKKNFSRFPNVFLVKGLLPDSISQVNIEKIAYLSVDLNNARYEKATIEALWDKLVAGAIIVLDDYGFKGHEPQYKMWNEFASSKGRLIMTCPTGQGLLMK